MADIEVIAEGKYVRFVRRGRWEFVERTVASGVVAIIAVTPEGKMVLVEQMRAPFGKRLMELPAGLAGDVPGTEKEALSEAAKRELLEETGYEASEMKYMAEGAASAGLCDEVITFFKAGGLKKVGKGGGDESENITVHEVPVNEVPAWLDQKRREGYEVDLKIYGGLYFATR